MLRNSFAWCGLALSLHYGSLGAQVPVVMPTHRVPATLGALPAECAPCFLPVRSAQDAEEFWGRKGPKALTNATIMADQHFFATDAEIVSDIMAVFRLGFGVAVSSAHSDTTDAVRATTESQIEATKRLLQQGGTVYTSILFPVAYFESHSLNAALVVQGGAGWDFPSFGQIKGSPSIAATGAIDLSARASSERGLIGFDGGLRLQGYVFNSAYAAQVNVAGTSGAVANARIGLLLFSQTRIGLSLPLYSSGALVSLPQTVAYLQQAVGL
jgi:hypothetical protein